MGRKAVWGVSDSSLDTDDMSMQDLANMFPGDCQPLNRPGPQEPAGATPHPHTACTRCPRAPAAGPRLHVRRSRYEAVFGSTHRGGGSHPDGARRGLLVLGQLRWLRV